VPSVKDTRRFGRFFSSPQQFAKRHPKFVFAVAFIISTVATFSYLTNPFVRFTLVRDPLATVPFLDNQFVVHERGDLRLRRSPVYGQIAIVKSGWHIVSSRFSGGPKTKSSTVDEIIREIHARRFRPEEPYLISGDHFSVLYPRSLGIFYHTLMDPRTPLDETDWKNRQELYLKTTAYALDVYSQSDRLSTTIVPIGPKSVALLNIYATPSDTLYSLLYALDVMRSDAFLERTYPFPATKEYVLHTSSASAYLTETYKNSLRAHVKRHNDLLDPETGLIRKDILISSTKDITERQGAFYDNVILWRTNQLAQELGIVEKDETFLESLKNRIISAYWLENEGYFLEDLSDESLQGKYYSSDWLIILMTGFLDINDENERKYYERSVEYIQRNAIDQPFGLQYHPDVRRERQYPLVRLLAPSYGSTAIWSNWGMEYIKTLTLLGRLNNDTEMLREARRQLEAYTFNIKRYQGYPELYDSSGDFYQKFLYKSVRQTGWVVTYEQARMMLNSDVDVLDVSATSKVRENSLPRR
jgi:hypothetical protein